MDERRAKAGNKIKFKSRPMGKKKQYDSVHNICKTTKYGWWTKIICEAIVRKM